ncbi:MAG: hypothetical protein BVN29_06970 [Nitrospira sp. ST-bin5]|nr:MAG: hypothetical protein BVN29_06970 [Nitrospira sp. ST-bin5]
MTWLDKWRALEARIDGLIRAGEFLALTFQVNSGDAFNVVRNSFLPELVAISAEIKQLGDAYSSELPKKAYDALNKYIALDWHNKSFKSGSVDIQALAPLAAFRSEFSYLLRDAEIEGRNLTELAFEHLRRQLVVDEDIRKKWQTAFRSHETACEKLGAVHLLSHGIWAFKFVAPGGATDLVFGDPIGKDLGRVKRTARAFVLTEWKLVKRENNIEAKAREGRAQAAIYSGGVLGDTELNRTRYVVLVCELDLPVPDDVSERNVVYRHVVLPMQPKSPSATARSKKALGKS